MTPARPQEGTGEGEGGARWWRNSKGTIVHADGCHRIAATALPWNWADREFRDDQDLVEGLPPWVKSCRQCLPKPRSFRERTDA